MSVRLLVVINLILIKFELLDRLIALIINNAINNFILYRNLLKYLLIINFNNLINVKKDKSLQSLYYILDLIYII